jgi:hypothetical protein
MYPLHFIAVVSPTALVSSRYQSVDILHSPLVQDVEDKRPGGREYHRHPGPGNHRTRALQGHRDRHPEGPGSRHRPDLDIR